MPPAERGRETLDDAYRRLRPALVRLAYLLTGSEAQAEDVVHHAVVAASRRWDGIDDPDPYLRRAVPRPDSGDLPRARGMPDWLEEQGTGGATGLPVEKGLHGRPARRQVVEAGRADQLVDGVHTMPSGPEDWPTLCGTRPGDPALPGEEAGQPFSGVIEATGANVPYELLVWDDRVTAAGDERTGQCWRLTIGAQGDRFRGGG